MITVRIIIQSRQLFFQVFSSIQFICLNDSLVHLGANIGKLLDESLIVGEMLIM